MSIPARRSLDRALDQLKNDLLMMGGLVAQALQRALECLQSGDPALAQQIVDGDREINRVRFRIEEECLTLIATQQPAASDLRFVMSGINIAGDLERMGDHAAGIGKTVVRMHDEPHVDPIPAFLRMGAVCQSMLQASLEAFRAESVELARGLADQDDEVDRLYNDVLNEMIALMVKYPDDVATATHMLWCAHNLERFGDRATNIGERVIFMTTGSMKELNV